ncbi:hypothetical protein HGM15179_007727 [Zosterops borbonicus]|uniref:Uncharacterized protein n=1 Tax=Zosterops borbonicus TaxID=364589 RepID=A0A8K1LMG8_9PASS|nr:hypothetical protein HGM15179_007727 [Zosterops borbonicus]
MGPGSGPGRSPRPPPPAPFRAILRGDYLSLSPLSKETRMLIFLPASLDGQPLACHWFMCDIPEIVV